MKSYKLLLFFLCVAILSCNKESSVTLLPASEKDFKLFKRLFDIDSTQVHQSIEIGLFQPEYNCLKKLPLKPPPSKINEKEIEKSLKNPTNKESIVKLLEVFYKLFGDPAIPQNENFDYNQPISNILDSLYTGVWAPQCGGIAHLSKKIINQLNSRISLKVMEIDYPVHVLNLIEFSENNIDYKLAIDFQNGFIFPYDTTLNDFLPYKKLENSKTEYLNFYFSPKEVLYSKRNFLTEALPCNVMIQKKEQYLKAPPSGPYRFIRLTKSFHNYLWFELKQKDESVLKKELLAKLLEKQHY